MSESLILPPTESKAELYAALIPQLKALVEHEQNNIANLANIAAALKETFNFLWVGFYLKNSSSELVLGPFQGPIACTRIKKGKGVCGTSWEKEATVLVQDVEQFPGHIACSSLSKSEIVVPIFDSNNCFFAVLDVDSGQLDYFDEADQQGLEQIAAIIQHDVL